MARRPMFYDASKAVRELGLPRTPAREACATQRDGSGRTATRRRTPERPARRRRRPMTVVTAATSWEASPLARALGLEEAATRGLVRERPLAGAHGHGRRGRALRARAARIGPWRSGAGDQLRLRRRPARGCPRRGHRGGPGRRAPRTGVGSPRRRPAAGPAAPRRAPGAQRPAAARAFGEAGARRQDGGAGVDMESSALKDWAASRGARFAALRAVFDGLEDRLPERLPPPDASASRVARYALGSWREAPHLFALWRRHRRVCGGLCEFLRGVLCG